MCNVHVVYCLTSSLNKKDFNSIFKMMYNASRVNKDGFGLFDDNGIVFKNENAFDFKFSKDILGVFNKECKFLVGHNRLKTHGSVSKGNSHPFNIGNFIFAHNGIVENFEDLVSKYKFSNVEVDSVLIGLILNEKHKVFGDVVKSIVETTKELMGSYSCFVFDTKSKRLFYFKNEKTNFEFWLVKKNENYYIFGSTTERNMTDIYIRNMYGFGIRDYEVVSAFVPCPNVLYEISEKGITKVCDIEFQKYSINVLELLLRKRYGNSVSAVVNKKGNVIIEVSDVEMEDYVRWDLGEFFADKKKMVVRKNDIVELVDYLKESSCMDKYSERYRLLREYYY